MILVKDERPITIDSGFGSDAEETVHLIRESGIFPSDLQLLVNTYYHSDHVGGNNHLQSKFGVQIAAHKWEAALINSRDPEACSAEWLDQPVKPYEVNRLLTDNDEITTGRRTFNVLHTPGHTLGHVSLYEPEEGILIYGDLFHRRDVGWFNIFREGVAAIQRSLESLERVRTLRIVHAYSGHGPQINEPLVSIDLARERLEKWLKQPEKVSWHACKRIFAFTLMMKDGLAKEKMKDYLLRCGWFQDFSRYSFQLQPDEFVQVLVDKMIWSGAADWKKDYLVSGVPYIVPEKDWLEREGMLRDWNS